jgi:hypothetical protein
MKWKDIKAKIESVGVKDDDEIWLIEIAGEVEFIRAEKNEGKSEPTIKEQWCISN